VPVVTSNAGDRTLPARICADDVGIGRAVALGVISEDRGTVFASAAVSEIGGGGGAGLEGWGVTEGDNCAVRGASLRFELTAGRVVARRELEAIGIH
jgi:hypothetical protein